MHTKRILTLCMVLLIPSIIQAQDNKLNLVLENQEHISVKSLISKFSSYVGDTPLTFLETEQIIHKTLPGNRLSLLIKLRGYTDFDWVNGRTHKQEHDKMPSVGGFAFFNKRDDAWQLQQIEMTGEYLETLEFHNLMNDGKEVLVARSGMGNHAHFMKVYQLDGMKFKEILNIEGYGIGPEIIKDNGKEIIVDFKNSLLGTCESCQVYHEQVYRWDGKEFKAEKDELGKAEDEYSKSYEDEGNKLKHCEKSLQLYQEYLKTNPNSFAAVANCAYLYNELGQKDKVKPFNQLLEKLVDMPNTECPHCTLETLTWDKRNRQRVLDQIAGN